MTTTKGTLLVLNYVMDANHPVLSHQAQIVDSLSEQFSRIVVVTGHHNTQTIIAPNVLVIDTHWVAGQNLRNVLRFYVKFFGAFRNNPEVEFVFSHMTVIQSVLVSPILLLKRIPHILWYAHRASNLPLRLAGLVVQRILTSTSGSCPLKGEKVRIIGQGIDTKKFKQFANKPRQFLHAVHIGRADKSKRLDLLIHEIQQIRNSTGLNVTLNLIGSPSNQQEINWFKAIQRDAKESELSGWLNIQQGVNRLEVPELLSTMDIFVHAFEGSLDKTLVEATLCRIPVLTLNPEYLNIFGSWEMSDVVSIPSEFQAITSRSIPEIEKEIDRRFQIAYNEHSYDRWIDVIVKEILFFRK